MTKTGTSAEVSIAVSISFPIVKSLEVLSVLIYSGQINKIYHAYTEFLTASSSPAYRSSIISRNLSLLMDSTGKALPGESGRGYTAYRRAEDGRDMFAEKESHKQRKIQKNDEKPALSGAAVCRSS